MRFDHFDRQQVDAQRPAVLPEDIKPSWKLTSKTLERLVLRSLSHMRPNREGPQMIYVVRDNAPNSDGRFIVLQDGQNIGSSTVEITRSMSIDDKKITEVVSAYLDYSWLPAGISHAIRAKVYQAVAIHLRAVDRATLYSTRNRLTHEEVAAWDILCEEEKAIKTPYKTHDGYPIYMSLL